MEYKFVCLQCGSHMVEGCSNANVEVEINEKGEIKIVNIDYYEFDLYCSKCDAGGEIIRRIGE